MCNKYKQVFFLKILYESREKVTKLFNDYSKFASKATYRSIHGKVFKILTPKHINLVQLKAGNLYKNLLNEVRQSYIFCFEQKKLSKIYAII